MCKLKINYRTLIFYFSFLIPINFALKANEQGIVRVPIAHLVGQPLGNDHAYQALPTCGATHNPYQSCPRMHQLLLHETVTIIKQKDNELLIDVPHVFFITQSTKVPQTRYWTSKKNILSYGQLKKNKVNLELIPKAIIFKNPSTLTKQNNVVTLLKPFYDETNKLTYSAGTRFIKSRTNKNKKVVYVHALNPLNGSLHEVRIPSTYLIETPQGTVQEKIQTFVEILTRWAHPEKGFIPYIWGGCSYIHLESSPTILEHKEQRNGSLHSWYTRKKPHKLNAQVNSGFDCAGLINRAAQMAGIPFFFKNTTTIAKNMREIKPNEQLQAGDIVWVRGHVMVIADTKKNTIIEARGYDGDYGKVHEIELYKLFEGVRTMADLKQSWLHKTPLKRLNKAGKVQNIFKEVKLLKIESVFKKT